MKCHLPFVLHLYKQISYLIHPKVVDTSDSSVAVTATVHAAPSEGLGGNWINRTILYFPTINTQTNKSFASVYDVVVF